MWINVWCTCADYQSATATGHVKHCQIGVHTQASRNVPHCPTAGDTNAVGENKGSTLPYWLLKFLERPYSLLWFRYITRAFYSQYICHAPLPESRQYVNEKPAQRNRVGLMSGSRCWRYRNVSHAATACNHNVSAPSAYVSYYCYRTIFTAIRLLTTNMFNKKLINSSDRRTLPPEQRHRCKTLPL